MLSAASAQTLGIYLTAIQDIDISRSSFTADFYVWTKSPADAPDPLAKVTIVRAKTQKTLYEWKENFSEQVWSLRKYRCEINNDWDVRNFPFDRHVLAIAVIPNSDEYTSRIYQVDEKNSAMANYVAPHGWKITHFNIFGQTVAYDSNFGDPHATGPYQYNAVIATFLLTRRPWRPFFKLMGGAYLAAAAALLGCFMKTNHPPIFSGRIGLQIACLFAAIVNHRGIAIAAGEKDTFVLPDALHLLTYVLIFLSLLLTLRSRSLSEHNAETRALRGERRTTLCLGLLFLLLNGALVWAAMASAPISNMLQLIQIGE